MIDAALLSMLLIFFRPETDFTAHPAPGAPRAASPDAPALELPANRLDDPEEIPRRAAYPALAAAHRAFVQNRLPPIAPTCSSIKAIPNAGIS
ncbi:MAG: hypothetical protein LBI87_06940 [Candidatus Accumulibacter sp.]|jgi:hypothetical protein|nr:hypothetical protein [Accumulibacter sp.]